MKEQREKEIKANTKTAQEIENEKERIYELIEVWKGLVPKIDSDLLRERVL